MNKEGSPVGCICQEVATTSQSPQLNTLMHLHPCPCKGNKNANSTFKHFRHDEGSLIRFNSDGDGMAQPVNHNTQDEVEILVMGNMASNQASTKPRKEDEHITSAVMKVLQGYQWSLVPTTTK